MSEPCTLCGEPLNPYDTGVWKEVVGWVGGPRKDSMRLRHDTGRHAHDRCVAKVAAGQAPDQPGLDEFTVAPERNPKDVIALEDMLNDSN